jgi:acetyl-CoA C-acetyltransferase
MLLEASNEAIEASAHSEIDAVVVGAMAPEAFGGEGHVSAKLADALGKPTMPAIRVENGPATGGTAFQVGVQAVASGQYGGVLVAAAEKMTHMDSRAMAAALGGMLPQAERAMGLTMPGLAAMLTRVYMEETGLSREDLAKVPVKAHRNGSRNPKAHFREEVTVEDVLKSPMVADPLHRLDCAPLTDGAAAVLLTSRSQPVKVAGTGHANDLGMYAMRKDLSSFAATRGAAKEAFKRAKKGPNDMDVIETHDAFSVLELLNLEDLGFFERGHAFQAFEMGELDVSGALPVNPSGGLKARGHPLSATGLAQVAEVYSQLAGKAEGRQVDAAAGLAHNIGGFGTSVTVAILEIA